jgi:hypothetical protein
VIDNEFLGVLGTSLKLTRFDLTAEEIYRSRSMWAKEDLTSIYDSAWKFVQKESNTYLKMVAICRETLCDEKLLNLANEYGTNWKDLMSMKELQSNEHSACAVAVLKHVFSSRLHFEQLITVAIYVVYRFNTDPKMLNIELLAMAMSIVMTVDWLKYHKEAYLVS